MWPVMAHHLSAEQLNINSLFTAAASTPLHSCAPAWLATSFAGSLPPPLSTQSALAVRSGLPLPASHGDAIPPKLSSNMSHMKNRCTPQLPLIVGGSFVIAVRTHPGPRPSEFRRHRGREYAHIDGVHPTYVHGIMERTLHYILAHVVHSPLSLSPCRSWLAAASSILRAAAASFLHAASVSPLLGPDASR
ncbi:hypothetical protein B0H14DRAFT_3138998 [Mycena olivaceomarginata]|nr:hypothetical protein B0H14DRAFT_3138998 [Mycena olivaceomarginata]